MSHGAGCKRCMSAALKMLDYAARPWCARHASAAGCDVCKGSGDACAPYSEVRAQSACSEAVRHEAGNTDRAVAAREEGMSAWPRRVSRFAPSHAFYAARRLCSLSAARPPFRFAAFRRSPVVFSSPISAPAILPMPRAGLPSTFDAIRRAAAR